MLFLCEQDVAALLTADLAIDTAREAFVLAARGGLRARGALRQPGRYGALLLASAHDGLGLSVKSNIHVYPADGGPRRTESLLSLWDIETGTAEALIAARTFNDLRTAGGLAAGALGLVASAPTELVIFGTGKMAGPAARLLVHAFPSLARITFAGRTAEKGAAFADRLRENPDFAGVALIGIGSGEARAAVATASIIVTVTTAATPIVYGADIAPGALVILAGANRPDAREADDALLRRATIYCDALEGIFEKAGDLTLARHAGALTGRTLREVGAGRRAAEAGTDITVFKSIGLGEQDLLLARVLVERARTGAIGLHLDPEHGAPARTTAGAPDGASGETLERFG
ncbi:hypothetical protein L1787_05910 [Acuticoccus sp. M5D2P5]|uniref:ornithine cyclodeaminase family protein n=1 Tax=Acuticoccus kalidii TaxID=2910977 RepID=UPI001F19C7EC|nr:hypothetical protein [Acuticoccus kalidii]MCF3932949.1 hypothetical protein [Acuticoccus kalidii]